MILLIRKIRKHFKLLETTDISVMSVLSVVRDFTTKNHEAMVFPRLVGKFKNNILKMQFT